jgi:adenine-specific DNA-methyltransferase
MPRQPRKPKAASSTKVETFVHTDDQRTNIPTAELETFMKDEDRAQREVTFPRPSELLYPRDPAADPQLVWRGKDEQDSRPLEVMAPPIYIQEKIHPKAIIEDLRKQKTGEAPGQAGLFSDFNGIEFEDLVDFYQHEQHWSNRMILGDSLEVMTSLAEREGLKGQVQCIYMDPPYGIKFGSNWQVSTRDRDVTDGKVADATRQPEQVKAFRDTWEFQVHSYLTYLRDRLIVSRSLLGTSGSLFLQIGDQNIHLVRSLLDEVFGPSNFVGLVTFRKTAGATAELLAGISDYILWYARDKASVKFRRLYVDKTKGKTADEQYRTLLLQDGSIRGMTAEELKSGEVPEGSTRIYQASLVSQRPPGSFPVTFQGEQFTPSTGYWKTNPEGMKRLIEAQRVVKVGKTLRYVRSLDDFPAAPISNAWDDTVVSGFADPKQYVVQTSPKVIQRCLLMATDPGDLVLDPTCGSGTTAYIAEQWGRRWITIDTSRVALALARQRLMAAKLPFYAMADVLGHDLRRGFRYRTVNHVTLKSIAQNPDIHEGMTRSETAKVVAKHAEQEVLYDQPEINRSIVRVTGPFTVESLSPLLGEVAGADRAEAGVDTVPPKAVGAFVTAIVDNLRAAGVQNTVRDERLTFDRLDPWPGKYIHAVGEYSEGETPRRAAITIGPQYGTVDADLVRDAAKEAAAFFDILIVCGFAFDAYITNEFKQLGNLTILKANMNPDLSMGGDLLKKTGKGNLFTVFGEPDIDLRRVANQVEMEIRGLDVYDPTTGQIRSHTTADIACWFIDTAYDGNSFFVRHAYFTGAGDPYKSLKAALRADIDEEAWASLYSTVSRPFDVPATGRIAVKVINHYGDEVMKVYDVPLGEVVPLPQRGYMARSDVDDLMVADRPAQD